MPMKVRPLPESSAKRRTVSRKLALPASMMMSRSDSTGRSSSICSSTGLPACTSTMIGRGGRIAAASSSMLWQGMMRSLRSPAFSMNASVRAGVRLNTAMR